jgi:hypothetical protein
MLPDIAVEVFVGKVVGEVGDAVRRQELESDVMEEGEVIRAEFKDQANKRIFALNAKRIAGQNVIKRRHV